MVIDPMEGNQKIFGRAMKDPSFRAAAQDYIAREVYERLRVANPA
ncbi:hypothetical protein QTN93_15190 [Sphingomonas aerolata]